MVNTESHAHEINHWRPACLPNVCSAQVASFLNHRLPSLHTEEILSSRPLELRQSKAGIATFSLSLSPFLSLSLSLQIKS